MGAVPSTQWWSSAVRPQDTVEYQIGTFVGEKSFPLASDYWQKLLDLPLNLHWPAQRVLQACEVLAIKSRREEGKKEHKTGEQKIKMAHMNIIFSIYYS